MSCASLGNHSDFDSVCLSCPKQEINNRKFVGAVK